ncbi:1-deoxy-D-xylulose-5-phosphate reductoisomerase [Zooshikella ganghwensis]|uniref:1-deoxy-D-xylulose 5-phosphate reductoisomerase n=1 Tax=Zooshikella ganghwensis TaxID=202772 RepID=A0A4P9VNM3_9GAMM|nr:1-deoxy-D-xylulose-5-phosphate reductoisomerase [Zooshikella ganghwensis]RDH45023.1 1-deoxy-D-xylulose-5-phosphate reductoisomerase [Zooshikella ganghwensis]
MQNITILGSTGSIGCSTLDVIAQHPSRYQVFALAAQKDVTGMLMQCQQFQPKYAVMADSVAAGKLRELLSETACKTEVLTGEQALAQVSAAAEVDTVMAAIVGAAGLLPTLAAVKAGKKVLLANKEALVMSGALFMQEVTQAGATLLPIDSEHNAIFQCLPPTASDSLSVAGIRKILLTASGGPFRNFTFEELQHVTPEQACNHPNWSMGRKISVDSATLMNKGLEFIEACWLFSASPGQVEVVIHPQSIIHSMVDYIDGSVLAQLGNPDMRTPIAHALAWPQRMVSGVSPLDLAKIGQLDFEAPNEERFPCLKLAKQAVQAGGTAMAILNAANEVAVDAFLADKLTFMGIAQVNDAVLNKTSCSPADSLEHVLEADRIARECAQQIVYASN